MPPPTVSPSQLFRLNIIRAEPVFGQTFWGRVQMPFPQHVLIAQTISSPQSALVVQVGLLHEVLP